jgi:hypothetical protein
MHLISMSRPVLVLLVLAVGLGLYLWFIELPAEQKRAQAEIESTQLVNFKESDVQSFTLDSATGAIELKRNSDRPDVWTITQPKAMDADRQTVEEFLRTLILAKITRVVDEAGKDLSTYGLATPSLSVSVRLASGALTVRFGDSGPRAFSLYAKREGDPKILLTSVVGREILSKGVQDFRRKHVFEFDRGRVTVLKIENQQETVVLNREGHGDKALWTIKAPVQTTADQPEVRSLLFALEDLKAQAFIDDPQERRKKMNELRTPAVTITVHEDPGGAPGSGTERTIRLFLTPQNSATAFAVTAPDEPIYLVPGTAANTLAKNLFVLRNKHLIAADPQQIKTLVIKKDNDEYSLTHEGADWLIDGDPHAKADAGRINTFVSRAVQLQAERIVTDKPADLKTYGLAVPAAELTVADSQGKMLGRLVVGNQQNNLAYAQGTAIPGIFQIRPDILKEIPKKNELIKPSPP